MRFFVTTLVFLIAILSGFSQQILQFDEALKIAIENNHTIRVAINKQQQSENNATIGNAGMLPKIDLVSNYNTAESKADVNFATGLNQSDLQSKFTNTSTKIEVSYSVFRGLAAITTYQKLKDVVDLSALQTRLNIESTLLQVSNAYYEIARQQMQLEVVKENLGISKERVDRAKSKVAYGAGGKLMLLNAQVDFNTDSITFLELENNLRATKRNLNLILARDIDSEFSVEQNIELNKDIQLENVETKTKANNANLLLAQTNLDISQLDKKLQLSYLMPAVSLSGDYGLSGSTSNTSFVLSSSSLGYSAALSLSWNLFDGGKKRTALQNASIAILNNELAKQQATLTVSKDLANAFDLYSYRVKLLAIQQQNIEVAQLNFERSKELFNQGQLTTAQFREAQLNLNTARVNIHTTQFIIKLSEIELMRLSGDLIN